MGKRFCLFFLLGLLCIYVLGPFVAGSCRVGFRSGPVIYPQEFHRILYTLGHEWRYDGEKPREPLDAWMYDRPLFYGLPRRPKSREARDAYIERMRENQSPMLERLIRMNHEVE